jgi:hypothetical protein
MQVYLGSNFKEVRKDIFGYVSFSDIGINSLLINNKTEKEKVKVCYFYTPSKYEHFKIMKDFKSVEFMDILDGTDSSYIPDCNIKDLANNLEELEKWQREAYRIVIQVSNPVNPEQPYYLYTVNGKVQKIGK